MKEQFEQPSSAVVPEAFLGLAQLVAEVAGSRHAPGNLAGRGNVQAAPAMLLALALTSSLALARADAAPQRVVALVPYGKVDARLLVTVA